MRRYQRGTELGRRRRANTGPLIFLWGSGLWRAFVRQRYIDSAMRGAERDGDRPLSRRRQHEAGRQERLKRQREENERQARHPRPLRKFSPSHGASVALGASARNSMHPRREVAEAWRRRRASC